MEKFTKSLAEITIVLALSFGTSLPVLAMTGRPVAQTHSGVVQNIDYLHHAITINGQTYAVAPNATFSGVADFSILHIGMPIAYDLSHYAKNAQAGDTAPNLQSTSALVIVHIAWLPGGA